MSRRDEDEDRWRVTDGTAVKSLRTRWTISRTSGYDVCTLFCDDVKVAACNGGGYDMVGTVLGDWLACAYPDRLTKLTTPFSGLSFCDPDFDPAKALIDGETVEQREAAGKSAGLERYQAFHMATSKLPTERHRIPLIDGAHGKDCVLQIAKAIGVEFEYRSMNHA